MKIKSVRQSGKMKFLEIKGFSQRARRLRGRRKVLRENSLMYYACTNLNLPDSGVKNNYKTFANFPSFA